MHTLLENARGRGATQVQLEVIKGNEPALRLFVKLGFEHQRELLIIRRPPGTPKAAREGVASALDPAEIAPLLENTATTPAASWVEEARSITRAGNLRGFRVALEDGVCGWMIYQMQAFQINHVVFDAPNAAVVRALLLHLHSANERQDTKIENLPADDPYWPIFQEVGYVEAFRRHEMMLTL
jgi:hypothetical protein